MSTYDQGHSSPKSTSSEDSVTKLFRENELRREVGLPPILSRNIALTNASGVQSPCSNDMEVLDYGSADEYNPKVALSASESSGEEDDALIETNLGPDFDMNVSVSMEMEPNDNVKSDQLPVLERSRVFNAASHPAEEIDDLIRLANHYAKTPREEAARERAKNMELKEYIFSKGFNMQDVNDHFMQTDNLRARQVDDLGFFIPSKVNQHLQDLKNSFTVDRGILTLGCTSVHTSPLTSEKQVAQAAPARILSLPWSEVVKGSSQQQPNRESSMSRVSALDPSRLLLNNDKQSTNASKSLSFKPTAVGSGSLDPKRIAIAPPMEFLKEARKMWDTSLVAYFASASLTFDRTRVALFKLWGSMGLQKVFYNSKGFYTLRFDSIAEMKAVLNLGSIIIDRKKLYLRPWMEGTHFHKDKLTSVPLWLKFVNVPHSYWSMEGLSYIASAIGVPISLDSPTSNMEPMKFARICVSLKFDSPRPSEILVPVLSDEDGSSVMERVLVEYPSLPPNCSHCKCFGHSLAKCSLYRLSMDATEHTSKSLLNVADKSTTPGRRSGKEPMDCTIQTSINGKSSSPVMLNFAKQNDSGVQKDKNMANTVVPANPLVNASAEPLTAIQSMNTPPTLINNMPAKLSQSSVSGMEKMTATRTNCNSWSLGTTTVVLSNGALKQNAVTMCKQAVGPVTIDFGNHSTSSAHITPAQKPKRKKRATKKSKNLTDEHTGIKYRGSTKTMTNLNATAMVAMEGKLDEQGGSGINLFNSSPLILPGVDQGFTRVTRRTANKKPMLEGKPAPMV